MSRMAKRKGKITIQAGVKVWPHELHTAEALIEDGYDVDFVRKDETDYCKSADALLNGILHEMKAPQSSHLSVVDKNIKKALSQSPYIVLDSKRMKNAKDFQVERELLKSIAGRRKIKSLIFVDKKRAVHKLK